MTKIKCIAAVMAALMLAPAFAQGVDVRAFVKKEVFRDIKLSPNGDYYAAGRGAGRSYRPGDHAPLR